MPESVKDRPTKSHEHIFLLAKSATYYYDAEAIAEESICAGVVLDYTGDQKNNVTDSILQATRPKGRKIIVTPTRNKRDVWTVPTATYKGEHFATFPPALILPCILAGCPTGGTVLDPFGGSGTTGEVASGNGRSAVMCELNPDYAAQAQARCGLFCASGKEGP
jgi:site-specific DNA-methyltransferase (adenine-specific)